MANLYINYNDLPDEVKLFPTCYSTTPVYRQRKFAKHTEMTITYYKGFKKIRIPKKVDEVTPEIKQEFLDSITDYNKINDVLTIKKEDITDDILQKFRYCPQIVEYEEQELPIDPYIFGLWLGDGHSRSATITNIDKKLIEIWEQYASENGCNVTVSDKRERKTKVKDDECEFVASYRMKSTENNLNNKVLKKLQKLDVIKNKHIPDMYLKNSTENRLKLLAGIIDTDGGLNGTTYEIHQKNEKLSKHIAELAKSLGLFVNKAETIKKIKNINFEGKYYRIHIHTNQVSPTIPVVLDRKKLKKTINYCNPKIVREDDKKIKKVDWEEEDVKALLEIVEGYKGKRVPWSKIVKENERFSKRTPDGCRNKYKEYIAKNV